MKRKWCSLLMGLIMLFSSAFGIAVAEEPVELVMFAWFGEGEREIAEAIVQGFEATHPNIRVDDNYITYNDYHSKLNTLIAAGETPDVFIINDFFVNEWGSEGIVLDLAELFAKHGRNVDEEYLPGAIFRTSPENCYGLSWCQGTGFLYYNKEIFEAADIEPPSLTGEPWTYDKIAEVGRMLTRDINGKTPNDEGFDPNSVVQYGYVNVAAQHWSNMELMLRSADVRFTEDGKTWSLFNEKGVAAIQKLADLALVHQCAPTLAIQRGTFSEPLVNLLNGQLAMLNQGSFGWQFYHDAGYDVGIAKLPMFDREAYVGGGAPFAIGATTKHPDEALELLTYFTTFENQLTAAENFGLMYSSLPADRGLFENEELMERWYPLYDKEIADVALDMLTKMEDVGANALVRNFSEGMETIVAPALDEVWLGEVTAAELAVQLAPQLEGVLGGFWGE